jgi:two-component system chemotaxis response regulator CheY
MTINVAITSRKLPATLDVDAAAGLLEMLQSSVQNSHPLHLDASGVETLTFPCAQILMAALTSHDQVAIGRPSQEFVTVFEEFGFAWREAEIDIVEQREFGNAREQVEGADLTPEPKQMNGGSMSKLILTIDDSRTIRDMLKLTLTEAGFEVLQGVDGEDGLNVLGETPVDLVITDINMPKMDGYEVIRRLRANSRYQKTPILVLTTESDADKRNIARQAGATGWIVKPFDPERLLETVRKVAP